MDDLEDDYDYSEFDVVDPETLTEPLDLADRVSCRYIIHNYDPSAKLVMFGEYEGIIRLGEGSFGHVFRARDPKLDRLVAIKVCKLADEEHRDMFLREAQLIARLSHHPNIVTIYELGRFESDIDGDEFDGAPFMVMELAEGLPNEQPAVRTGKDLLRKQLGWEDALDFYRGAGRGIAAAHAEGIVHGDFKPSNVLIGKRGAMVSDFGLAHTLGSAEGHAGGTEGYRAPELYGSAGNSPKTDQFAFCVALWELIVGRLPIEDMQPQPCPPGVMPGRLVLALLRGLSVDPAERWPSMDDLLEELGQIRTTSTVPKPQRPRLPGGFLVYALISGVVGALIVALVMGRSQKRAELREQPSTGPSAELYDEPPGRDSGKSPDEQPSDEPEANEETACAISEGVFLEPSQALEEVCKMIRAGAPLEAARAWERALEERTPDRTREQLMYASAETAVVIATFEDFLTTLDDRSPLIAPALDALAQMRDYYQRDDDELSSSR